MKTLLIRTIGVVCAAIVVNTVFAQSETGALSIKRLRTGWNDDVFSIETTNAIINPANCSMVDAYSSPVGIAAAGYKTYLAAALTAYSAGKQISIIIDNSTCSQSRPKIMGIYLL